MEKAQSHESSEHADSEKYISSLRSYYIQLYSDNPVCSRGYLNLQAIKAFYPELTKNRPVASMLDIGCAQGELTGFFANMGIAATGVDIVANPLWEGQREIFDGNVSYICGDFMEVELDGCFDLVVDSGCFHHQHPDVQSEYLRKIRRLMTSTHGQFLLTLFEAQSNLEDFGVRVLRDGRYAHKVTEESVTGILHDHDFEVLKTMRIPRENGEPYSILVHCA